MFIERFASIVFYLEASNNYYLNYNWHAAQECYRQALALSDISFELTGCYGKRTRYQQKELAQLLLKINESKSTQSLPKLDYSQWNYFNQDLDKNLLPKVNSFFKLL